LQHARGISSLHGTAVADPPPDAQWTRCGLEWF
jgi:hypothetical protein